MVAPRRKKACGDLIITVEDDFTNEGELPFGDEIVEGGDLAEAHAN